MEKNPTFLFVVAAALIDTNRNILVQKRPEGKPMAGLWEFPGGKVEDGEPPELALARELEEELGLIVDPAHLHPAAFASEPLGDQQLLLLLYRCETWGGAIDNPEADDIKWLPVESLADLPMPPADGPLVEQLALLMRQMAGA